MLLLLSLTSHAEPVGHEAMASAVEGASAEAAHPPLPVDEHPDPSIAAERAAIDALLHGQARHDRRAVLRQTYLEQPPTWIQTAARINHAQFPNVDDPTADAERRLDDMAWLAEQRLLAPRDPPRAALEAANEDTIAVVDDPGWLDLLWPSTWLPWVREHRDAIVAGGAALLLAGWGVNLSWQRLMAKARQRRRRHRRHRRHASNRSAAGRHADGRTGVPGAAQAAHAAQAAGADSDDMLAREARRRLRRRRRHRHAAAAKQPDAGGAPPPRIATGS